MMKYILPTMKEISTSDWNGYNVVSTFSGAGGSCLGYRMAGYKVLYANEFVESAREVYKKNHPNSYLDDRDIREVTPESILEITGMKKGEIDIFDGSPPCSAFSTMGTRDKGWNVDKKYSDTSQRVDDLFFEYTRLLEGLQPKVFVAENVTGLAKGSAKGYLKLIIRALKDCGYKVKVAKLNAAYLGVPQARERLIFMGVRNDLNIEPSYPKPMSEKVTVKEAWENLDPKVEKESYIKKHMLKVVKRIKSGKDGRSAFGSGKYFSWYRLPWHDTTKTLTTTATHIHPLEHRSLSIAEMKRICSFPDDFILSGHYKKDWERMGRAVPPKMMYAVAKNIEEAILCKIKTV